LKLLANMEMDREKFRDVDAKQEVLQTLLGINVDGTGGIGYEYFINGRPSFATVSLNLKEDQVIMGEAGSMLWMDSSLKMRTHMAGGCCDAFWRGCSGEPCCFNDYKGPGRVTFGFTEPGDALAFGVTRDSGWILSKGAFIAATPDCEVGARHAGCLTSCCTEEGPFLTMVTTQADLGMFFAGGYGEIIRHEIPDGKSMIVDKGLFFAANKNTDIHITILGDCCTALCSGEGVVMKFRGPCILYTQSRDPKIFDRAVQFSLDDEKEEKEEKKEKEMEMKKQ